jgi:NAD(P)-dependent dehydrogenase (short-subunit alcohol dehydrogenase family)
MDLQLDRRVVLLVGGNGTIGRAAQSVLRSEGAIVVVADGASTTPDVAIDVTSSQSIRTATAAVLEQHGRIDALVVLSALFSAKPAVEITDDEWDAVLDVNLKGTFMVCREILPHMQRAGFGRIVLLASLAAQIGGAVAGAHYTASKGAILSLAKSLARQARRPAPDANPAEIDITVNAISPGPVESSMTASWTAEERTRMHGSIPAGRFARPEEIADAIAWLVSPRTAYIHGARIDVNGGALMA